MIEIKTIEQLGEELCNKCQKVYNCSGSDVYENGNNVYQSDWVLPEEVKRFLQDELDYSQFPIRTGKHIETRPGGINFSILGRGENDLDERQMYVEHDKSTNERRDIANRLKDRFSRIKCSDRSQTGTRYIKIQIRVKILRDFDSTDENTFLWRYDE